MPVSISALCASPDSDNHAYSNMWRRGRGQRLRRGSDIRFKRTLVLQPVRLSWACKKARGPRHAALTWAPPPSWKDPQSRLGTNDHDNSAVIIDDDDDDDVVIVEGHETRHGGVTPLQGRIMPVGDGSTAKSFVGNPSGQGSLPHNWQAPVKFTQINFLTSTPSLKEITKSQKNSAPTPRVVIKSITAHSHPRAQQLGLFALEDIPCGATVGR